MESWLSLGLRIWRGDTRGLAAQCTHPPTPSPPATSPGRPLQVDERVQAANLLGSRCLSGAVGTFRCQWMHLRDPEAQVGSSLGEAPGGAGSPDSALAREGKGLLDILRVHSMLDSGLRGSWAG